ncbi:unnamed protein product [Victoria cruziana]
MYMCPPEICRLASLNRSFRGAASADFLWESKLPANYRYLLKKLLLDDLGRRTKKEIYALLSRPNTFDGGTKEVWLEKSTGAVCLSISSKALSITGIEDRRYWNYLPSEESRFRVVAYLQQIWWLEAHGELDFMFPAGTYSLYFRLQLGRPSKRYGRRHCNFDQVHGWDLKPVRFQFSTSDGQHALCQRFLEEPESTRTAAAGISQLRGNWMDYHVGDFVIGNSDFPTKIKFSMIQIDCTHTKGGLCIDSVLIVPTELVRRTVC